MKYRSSFVTNSSSSSFVCDVCGNTEGGYDMGLEDANMFECANGHTFCENHALKIAPKAKLNEDGEDTGDDEDEDEDEDADSRYDCDIRTCPICQFKAVHQGNALAWLMKQHSLTEKDILASMKKQYGDYETLQKDLKS